MLKRGLVFLTTTGITSIDSPISKLIGLILALVSAYGLILLIKNALDFFSALQERDSATLKTAGMGMLSGFGIASVAAVLSFLGFTW